MLVSYKVKIKAILIRELVEYPSFSHVPEAGIRAKYLAEIKLGV
jgi:hypothetical protein